MQFRNMAASAAAALVLLVGSLAPAAATKVTFDADGLCRIDGRRFFPVGVWVYNIDSAVLADLHEHRFNTVVGNGIKPADVPAVEQNGLLMVPMDSDEFLKGAKDSSSLLAWYLNDEPEERSTPPDELKKAYAALKAKDGDHPIGVTHDTLDGVQRYKGSCDFTMTDVYPVTANRDWPLSAVGQYTANTRAVNGPAWPSFTFIQAFGGPDSDGGKWAQPLPHEVRFMVFDALVHRASGILYFSYWPRGPLTWASISELNRDIERLVPWLIGDGEDLPASSSNAAIEIRARMIDGSTMILAVNTSKSPQDSTLRIDALGDNAKPRRMSDGETADFTKGAQLESFAPYEEKVYLLGPVPPPPAVKP
jgi:hypothetical protein